MDFRKQYLLNCVRTLLMFQEDPKSLVKSPIFDEFIREWDKLVLIFIPGKGKPSLKTGFRLFKPEEQEPPPAESQFILFLKLLPASQMTEINIAECFSITLMPGDSLKHLQFEIAEFYEPYAQSTHSDIAGILTTVKDSLGSSANQVWLRTMQPFDSDESSALLNRLTDEFEYWRRYEMNATSPAMKKKASYYNNVYKDVEEAWRRIGQIPVGSLMREVVEPTLGCLDSVWINDYNYPGARFHKLVCLFTSALWMRLSQHLSQIEPGCRTKLTEIDDLFSYWVNTLKEYKEKIWDREFSGSVDFSENITRLRDLKEVCQLTDELAIVKKKLDSVDGIAEVEQLFGELSPLSINLAGSKQWELAKRRFSVLLEKLDRAVLQFLKSNVISIAKVKERPQKALKELCRWNGFLQRPSISRTLQPEKELVLKTIVKEIDNMKNEYESRTGQSLDPVPGKDSIPPTKNFSPNLSAIIWTRQLAQRVRRLHGYCEELFAGAPELEQLKYEVNELTSGMHAYEVEQFQQWRDDMMRKLRDKQGEYSLKLNDRIMELDLKNAVLTVNYSEKLVLLIREIRQLTELGYRKEVPQEVIEACELGRKYFKEALALKKIANFYNNMSDEIMDSQKGMIVDELVYFEECVKSVKLSVKTKNKQDYISWDNPDYLDGFIQNLNAATANLLKENGRLRKLHLRLIESICQLAGLDLMRQREQWLEKLAGLRRLIEIACGDKDPKLCRKWKMHCDVQLYKVLEIQYLRGIEEFDSTSIDIPVEVVFRGKQLTLRPPLEEIKDRYYKEVRAYTDWPGKVFKGITGQLDLYQKIGQRNSHYLGRIYSKAEAAFRELEKHLAGLAQFAVIPYLSAVGIEKEIKNTADWEENIKGIRLNRKELERLPDHAKVQCFSVSHLRFKSYGEELLQGLLEAVMNALKNSLGSDVQQVEDFAESSLKRLQKKPESVEEMQKTKAEYLQIKAKQKEMNALYEEVLTKNKWIRQATGLDRDLTQLQETWRLFIAKIADFDSLLAEQLKHLKSLIKDRTNDLRDAITKYEGRTMSLMLPSSRADVAELIASLQQFRKDENDLKDKIKALERDCEQFEQDVPSLILKEVNWAGWDILCEYFEAMAPFENELFGQLKSARLFEFQDFCTSWQEKLRTADKSQQVLFVLKELQQFRMIFPLLKQLSTNIFERDHWRTFFGILKLERDRAADKLKLRELLNAAKIMADKANDIRELIARAQGETTIRDAIQELTVWCSTADFDLADYENNGRKTPLIREWKELTSKVSDNLSLVSSLKESKYAPRFADKIEEFEGKLSRIHGYLQKLMVIQRKWVYLQPIFIRGALPAEASRFERLDTSFRNIMHRIAEAKKVAALAGFEGLDGSLDTILEEEERCEKALKDYLEDKRNRFPRFYFLGDEDLLEILGQSKNPLVIQMHLKKLFAAIHSVEFNKDNTFITAICSSDGEVVQLNGKVPVSEVVEAWLIDLEKLMFSTLQGLLKQYAATKTLQLQEYPSQILCVMEEIRFSQQLDKAVAGKELPKLDAQLKQDLEKLTKILPTLSGLASLKLKAIILDLIHHMSIVSALLQSPQPITTNSYLYLKNFRAVGVAPPKLHLLGYTYTYTFEYQGNLPKLVHTPLTDKCFITLSLAMSLGFGGNPYGPAGTGKTETVKSLAMYFGRMCLVFNCDEGLDHHSMARIFLGLVRCGAWGCFDEFNRLLEEQLSAISQQIQLIQNALKAQQTHLVMLDKKVNVNPNSAIFVTLNPAGKGYGGRSKLPDNLKQLFRPVAMSVPDNELIAEVLLYSEGFKQAKLLAQKIICLFTLSRQLLSQQQHYDWGLRALKTILTVSGRLIFEERKKLGKELAPEVQPELLIKAIRINTLSKLTFPDMRKFKALLSDIFPGVRSEDIAYEQLEASIEQVLKDMKLCSNPNQISKILQFYEATKQRMGVVLVGPSGCGKTTIWKVLKRAYERMGISLRVYLINPKAIPRTQLLGNMNNDIREFSEGVLTASSRELVKNGGTNWIVLDGDIDPEWIESLNSVLDDNHLLTLPTGERISFSNQTCFIFETDSLLYASPATVSRMGMIYLNNEDINVSNVVERWYEGGETPVRGWLESLDLEKLLALVEAAEIVPSTIIGRVSMLLSMLRGVANKQQFIERAYKGLSANCDVSAKQKLLAELFDRLKERNPLDSKSLSFYSENGTFRTFTTLPAEYLISEILQQPTTIQTATIQNSVSVLKPWVDQCQPFIVVGPEGCGKGLLIREAFIELRKTQKINFAVIHCNSQTNASQVINKLYQSCMKGSSGLGRVLKPKDCSRLVLYLKDINLPKPDKYQTIQLISFLQQLISHKGFYDPHTLEFVHLDDKIQLVCSMLPSTFIGRHSITQRFTAITRILAVECPTNEELVLIYAEYFRSMLADKKLDTTAAKRLATFLVEAYTSIQSKFSVDDYRHYAFTPKSLYRIFTELMRYDTPTLDSYVEALSNELSRNYRDRLVGQEARGRFDAMLVSLVKQHFKLTISPTSLYSLVGGRLNKLKRDDYLAILKQAVTLYEREYRELQLVQLDETIQTVNALEKKLGSSGNVMLAGVSGIGRKTYLQLACLILRLDLVALPLTRDYGTREFRKDLRAILETVVNENRKQVLLLEDHHFSRPEFIEMINSLICSGEVPGLFSPEEFERLPCADDLKKEFYGISLYEAFCEKAKSNLKIVLSMDYNRESFQAVCAANPALYSCTIIWMDPLPSAALQALATELLTKELPELEKRTIDEASKLFPQLHKQMEEGYQSCPRDFTNALESYVRIYKQKASSKGNQAKHLQSGLHKLQEAKELVDQLSAEAGKKQKLLAVKQTEADEALSKISKAVQEATERKHETETLSKSLQVEEQKIQQKKKNVEIELSEVQPLIEEAKKAVSGINRKDLDELRALPKPPDAIRHVMGTVVRMFGESQSEWNAIKVFLKDRSVIDNILNFDPRSITQNIRRDVEEEMQRNAGSFDRAAIYRASVAAGPLCDWVKANVRYSKVLESIKPLETEMNTLLKALESSKKKVTECEQRLAALDQKVKELKESFAKKIAEAELLKSELKKAEDTLKSAKSLLTKLDDERIRWQKDSESIASEFKEYPMNSLLAAAFVAYLSDKDEGIREKLVKEWRQLTGLKTFNFLRFMTTESMQLKWRSEGLPSDSLSVENSVMIFATSKVPLLIDPDAEASAWLKKNNPKLESLNQQDVKFANTLELALRFGKELLVQELDSIEAILIPLIRRDFVQQAARSTVQVGDKQIDYNPSFRLMLCTRNSGIDLPANTRGLVSVINYSVTKSGVESKLLSIIINHEKPELEEKKIHLLEQQEKLKVSLDGLEKKLLEELAQSTGNILENTGLLDSLNRTKVESNSIAASLKESEVLNQKLDEEREIYRALATKGSEMYLLVKDLNKINRMYRFSLGYFTSLFVKCLEGGQEGDRVQKLAFAASALYKIVYNSIASSLFKKDRMAFALHLLHGIRSELFQAGQWEFFTQVTPATLENRVNLPKWAPFERKEIFNTFCTALTKLSNSINFNDKEWETWYADQSPDAALPASCRKLSSFQKVLLVQIFKPERLQSSVNAFLMEAYGLSSLAGITYSFKTIHAETTQDTPVLFIVSPGYDPSKELEEFCNEKVGKDNYKQLSMGGGQNDQALKILKEAADQGQWVCFKNLHLVTSWLPKLEKEFKAMKKHSNFRLFLTTEQHPHFPNILLDTCFKVCYEAPPGIKKNLLRIYQAWQPSNNPLKSTLLFLLAFFHSIVQERRTYIPQGWSKAYEFSYSDLKVAEQIIDNLVAEYERTKVFNFTSLYGIFEEGIYGGRVDNPFDLRVLRSYLKKYFNAQLLAGNKEVMPGMPLPKTAKEVSNFIAKLAETDSPQIYGLPVNIDQALQRTNTSQSIASLKLMMSMNAESIKFQKERWNKLLTPLITSWKQTYKHIKDSGFPQIKSSALLSEDPVEGFIFLEASQALEVLEQVNGEFLEVEAVVAGNGLLTTEIQTFCVQLLTSQLPKKWEAVWSGTEDPAEWIKSFGKKLYSLKRWVEVATSGNILNEEFDLSDLFRPQVFVNAWRQRISRNLKVAVDELKLVASLDQDKLSAATIIKVKGLLLQGCVLNANKMLEEGGKNLQEFTPLPVLFLSFVGRDVRDPYTSNVDEFPIFSSPSRERLLINVRLPVSGDINDRILGGVALMLRDV